MLSELLLLLLLPAAPLGNNDGILLGLGSIIQQPLATPASYEHAYYYYAFFFRRSPPRALIFTTVGNLFDLILYVSFSHKISFVNECPYYLSTCMHGLRQIRFIVVC